MASSRRRIASEEKQKNDAPWYRQRSYDGNLTEEEKRDLDTFRLQQEKHHKKHPAAEYGTLPEEVQYYISKLEIELGDMRGVLLMGKVLITSVIGLLLIERSFGWHLFNLEGSVWALLTGITSVVIPWLLYFQEQKKIWHDLEDPTENIRREWEVLYIVDKKLKAKRAN